jgi:phosphorylase kinase alpha/beta subunit
MRFQKPLVFREVLERAAVRYMAERATQMNSLGIETDLTVFMQQSPHIMNLYVTLIYAEITQPY